MIHTCPAQSLPADCGGIFTFCAQNKNKCQTHFIFTLRDSDYDYRGHLTKERISTPQMHQLIKLTSLALTYIITRPARAADRVRGFTFSFSAQNKD